MDNYRILAKGHSISNNTWKTKLNNNDLIVGPSGAGKTRYYVKPNIMQCNESMIVADTKGNLHQQLGGLLRDKGYEVMVIDAKNLTESYGYNPFDFIRYNSKQKTYREQDILTVATALTPITHSKEPFWDFAARQYLTCLIAYTLEAYGKEEHNLETVQVLLGVMDGHIFENLILRLEKQNPESFAVRQYRQFAENRTAERMHASIKGILSEKINPLAFSEVVDIYTAEKRVSFTSISKKKTALFLTVSDTDRSMDRLISLFYTQALHNLCAEADANKDGRLEVPVRFILDDFATNTIIEDFDKLISVIRSREIYVSIILQSITQLNDLYGSHKAKTIINNCDNWLYLGGQDVETIDVIAKKTNKPFDAILAMDLDSAYLLSRGSLGQEVEKYDITLHENYKQLPEYLETLEDKAE